MTLVVDADRKVADASLVRAVPEAPSYQGLARAGQKLARGLGEFMTGLMAAPATLSVLDIRLEDSPGTDGVVIRKIRLRPLDCAFGVAMNRAALMSLVDVYYGGEGAVDADRERLSPAEARFFSRVAAGFCNLVPAAWQSFATFGAELDDDDSQESGPVVVQTFSVAFAERSAFEIECRFPVRMLEAVPGLQSAAPTASEAHSDHNWQARLMDCALEVTFPVRAVFAEPELPLARLMGLRPGDIIPVCLPKHVDLTVAGLHLARGSAGESNGRAAICIEHL